MMSEENKRNNPRFNSRNLLSYAVYDSDDTLVRQGMGRTLNVSVSGILIETHIAVDTTHLVSLGIGFAESLIDIKGKPIYCRPGQKNMFETGIEFTTIDAAQRSILSEFIRAFNEQTQQPKD